MDYFNYKNGHLNAEDIAVSKIAESVGTPCYVYSRATIERHWHAFNDVLSGHDHLICYAVKANSNLAVLNLLARLGSGFDIVSGGELERVIAAGGDPEKVVFSGVGKSKTDIQKALQAGIACFNVESEPELHRINSIAIEMGKRAPVSLRVNPDVDANTHPYIATGLKENKFGIDIKDARRVYQKANQLENLDVIGIDCHIGSQLTDTEPFIDAADRLLLLIEQLESDGVRIRHLDVGGGLGITYNEELPPTPSEYASALLNKLGGRGFKIVIEPGRAIMGNAGILLTTVEYLKHGQDKNFAIVDAAMNDLLRPALYNAWQMIIAADEHPENEPRIYDVVGPVCETGDFLGKDRMLAISEGDLLAVRSSGAYGFTMSSNYNSRPRAAEVMVDGDQIHLIRVREETGDLFKLENVLP
ncbi:MAG: diaminopimelate decarboxylase [Gammaproteobacteria bacterium]